MRAGTSYPTWRVWYATLSTRDEGMSARALCGQRIVMCAPGLNFLGTAAARCAHCRKIADKLRLVVAP